jgi:zinc/manganese transport system permease protein
VNALDALLIDPFRDYAFMRRALAGGMILALAAAPIGVFLTLRRMSLMGEAVAHGILPGIAIAFLVAGLQPAALAAGGLVAGLVVALAAGAIARSTRSREDSPLAALYLTSLALGVALISTRATQVDLTGVLFGSALSLDRDGLFLIAAGATVVVVGLAVVWPALVLDSADPSFLQAVSRAGAGAHGLFIALVVVLLVSGFQAMGALMSVGLMVLPAAAARFWTERLIASIALAALIGVGSTAAGLVASFHFDAPSGPSIILVAGLLYALSYLLGTADGLASRLKPRTHYAG